MLNCKFFYLADEIRSHTFSNWHNIHFLQCFWWKWGWFPLGFPLDVMCKKYWRLGWIATLVSNHHTCDFSPEFGNLLNFTLFIIIFITTGVFVRGYDATCAQTKAPEATLKKVVEDIKNNVRTLRKVAEWYEGQYFVITAIERNVVQ